MKTKTKDKILNSAEKLFNRSGVSKTGVDDIAKTASVAKGTVYNYFGNKQGIIEEILKEKQHKFEETLASCLLHVKEPWEQIKTVSLYRFNLVRSSPFLTEPLLTRGRKNFEEMISALDNQLTKYINNFLDKIPDFPYDITEKNKITHTLILSLHGLEASIRKDEKKISDKEIDKELENLIWTIFKPAALV